MDNSVNIMRTRVDKLGVSEPLITKQGSNQIVIELPAVHDPTEAAQIIGQTASLELYDLTPSLYGPSIDASQNRRSARRASSTCSRSCRPGRPATAIPSAYYLFNSRTKKLIAGPAVSVKALKLDPAVQALTPLKPKTVTVKTKATKGHRETKTKVAAREDDAGLPDRLPDADRARPDRGHHLRRDDLLVLPRRLRRHRRSASPTTTSSSTASTRATPRARTRR